MLNMPTTIPLTSSELELAPLSHDQPARDDLHLRRPPSTDVADDRGREAPGRGHVDPRRPLGVVRRDPQRLPRHDARPGPRPVLPVQGSWADGLLRGAGSEGVHPGGVAHRLGGVRLAAGPAPGPQPGAGSGDLQRLARTRSPARRRYGARGGGAGLDSRVVVLVGDAELDEGSNHEAIELVGDLGLRHLTVVVVDNASSTYNRPGQVERRFHTEGWSTHAVDGRDHAQLRE